MREEDFYIKYVDFLFKNILNLDNKSILFISLSHDEKLEKIIKNKCMSLGINKVYFDYTNYEEKNLFSNIYFNVIWLWRGNV